jgi:diguanylate cyclase (GGDEF)-like protein
MALFSRDRLSEVTMKALASVSHIIALGIGRKQMQEQFHSAAITDELTGLFNRRGFFALAEQQCKLADRHKRGITLLYLDLDGMKNINDELGHKEGDRALKDIAHIFRRSLREADIIARIGGDEFAILLTDTTEPYIEKVIIGHIQNNIQIHNKKEGRKYELILSIGMSRYNPKHPCSIDDLLNRADTLMYKDKQLHKIEKDVPPLLNAEKFERRIYKRFRTGNNCWAELDITGKVKVETISMGGVHLLAPKPLKMNNMYKISISPSDHEEITLTGIVVWSAGKGPGGGKDSKLPYEAGLKFIELSDSLKSSLETFTQTFRKPD